MVKRPGTPSRARGTSKLPKSAFAYPSKRKYPINTKARARNALSRAAQRGTFGSVSHVRRRVLKRYPSLRKTKRRKASRRRR